MKELSVAIIGAGNIAGGFDENRRADDDGVYSHAGAYRAHGGFCLRTVLDANPTRAAAFQAAWQVDKVQTSFDKLLAEHHDVVSVCTPDGSHFPILMALLKAKCCKTIFAEKPLALELEQITEIADLASQCGIAIVCNYQRRYEPVHEELRRRVLDHPGSLLSVCGYYMKGLRHIGTTMIDSIVQICGLPDAVQSFSRTYSAAADDYSYEFVLLYTGFTVVVKTIDAASVGYAYHFFELDLLFSDGRATLVDISQGLRESTVTDYVYSGVKILNDKESVYKGTGYRHSMIGAAKYVYDVTCGNVTHTVNTPQAAYNNALIATAIGTSFQDGAVKLNFGTDSWKR